MPKEFTDDHTVYVEPSSNEPRVRALPGTNVQYRLALKDSLWIQPATKVGLQMRILHRLVRPILAVVALFQFLGERRILHQRRAFFSFAVISISSSNRFT